MDKLIALNLPGYSGNPINPGPTGLYPSFNSLGSFLTAFYPVVLYIAAFLMIFWMAWGVFQYILAGGDKEALSKARARITWSIVGFLILIVAFSVSQFAQRIFPQVDNFEKKANPVTTISTP